MCGIVFIHGYNSSGDKSNTGKVIEQYFNKEGHNTYKPTYNSYDPKQSIEYLINYVKNIVSPVEEDVIVVGISLGGYYARIIANKLELPMVLLNPSVNPDETLQQYDDPKVTNELLESYKQNKIDTDKPDIPISIVLAKNDDVIPYQIADDLFKERAYIVTLTDGGHRLEGEFVQNKYLDCIKWSMFNVSLPTV